MWVLLLTTHGCLATFSGEAGTFRVVQPPTMISCTISAPQDAQSTFLVPGTHLGSSQGCLGFSGGLQGRGMS